MSCTGKVLVQYGYSAQAHGDYIQAGREDRHGRSDVGEWMNEGGNALELVHIFVGEALYKS